MIREAWISPCGHYRYRLSRTWPDDLLGHYDGTALFVMLNPSTADALQDDPTIRRCIGFARSWGKARLLVGNLFAFRATDPRQLDSAADPIGPENDEHLAAMATEADVIVAAWGADKQVASRGRQVAEILFGNFYVQCLGKTAAGHPRHPLYLPKSVSLQSYRRAGT